MTIMKDWTVSQWVLHVNEPSLRNGHECRAKVKNLQPFTGNSDVFNWVKNSRVGRKTPTNKTKKPENKKKKLKKNPTKQINKENLSFHYHIIYYIEHHLTITFTCKSAALIVTQIALAVGHLSRRGFKGDMGEVIGFMTKVCKLKAKGLWAISLTWETYP